MRHHGQLPFPFTTPKKWPRLSPTGRECRCPVCREWLSQPRTGVNARPRAANTSESSEPPRPFFEPPRRRCSRMSPRLAQNAATVSHETLSYAADADTAAADDAGPQSRRHSRIDSRFSRRRQPGCRCDKQRAAAIGLSRPFSMRFASHVALMTPAEKQAATAWQHYRDYLIRNIPR